MCVCADAKVKCFPGRLDRFKKKNGEVEGDEEKADRIILYIDFRGQGKGMASINGTKGEQRLFSCSAYDQR